MTCNMRSCSRNTASGKSWLNEAAPHEIQQCGDAQPRWDAVWKKALPIEPLIPADRKQFYQASVLTMIAINRAIVAQLWPRIRRKTSSYKIHLLDRNLPELPSTPHPSRREWIHRLRASILFARENLFWPQTILLPPLDARQDQWPKLRPDACTWTRGRTHPLPRLPACGTSSPGPQLLCECLPRL